MSGQGHILTNAHVVGECSEVHIYRGLTLLTKALVLAKDERNDLALLQGSKLGASYAGFRRSAIRSGEDVIALGYPYRGLLASDVNVSIGIVSALAGLRNDSSQLQISAPVQPGNSGGPLLDRQGAVVGVVVAKLDALAIAKIAGDIPQNINFAVKGELAAAFLRGNGVEPRIVPDGQRPQQTADLVESGRNYTVMIECDPLRETREFAAREAAAEQERQRVQDEKRAVEKEEARRRDQLEAASREAQRRSYEVAKQRNDSDLRFQLPVSCAPQVDCRITKLFDHSRYGTNFLCKETAPLNSTGTTISFFGRLLQQREIDILAAADGEVSFPSPTSIQVDHGGGWITTYLTKGLASRADRVRQVERGERIGSLYATVNDPELTFLVSREGVYIDPFRENKDLACTTAPRQRWSIAQVDGFKLDDGASTLGISPSTTGTNAATSTTSPPITIARMSIFSRVGLTDETIDLQNYRSVNLKGRLKNPRVLYALVELAGARSGDTVRVSIQGPDGLPIGGRVTTVEQIHAPSPVYWLRAVHIPYTYVSGSYALQVNVERDGKPLESTSSTVEMEGLFPGRTEPNRRSTNEELQRW
ncbi:MAG: trypsin-like peptidase domain-containing protein [Rubrivivax sp.]|nr:trypsin-like peptidase domain-containing protein [Rubrivivax sp.]